MERHDHELKQREDQIIHITNESSLVISFELEIYFDYKGTEYGAYCTNEIEGRGIHNIGIYHRDIKPENVIIFEETYKLCDFGLAVMDNDMGRGSVGSIGFYSPEMSSDIDYSRKYADYWSLGCLILEQIIGNDVFTSEWLEVCYKKSSCLEKAHICNDFLENYYNKNTKINWSDVKCLLNMIPNNRILPHKVRRRTTSLERIIKIMERNKILSKKYEKIHPIED